MKKFVRFLALCLLFIPALVHADMGAPELRKYEAVVTNPNGIDYFDYEENIVGHFDKDQILTVVMEIGDHQLMVKVGDNLEGYYIENNGIMAKTEFVKPTDDRVYKESSERKAIVKNKKGVFIRKGPSIVYAAIGMIPYNTELTWQYYIYGGGGLDTYTHIYVDYKGIKGWIDISGENVFIDSERYIFFSKEYQLSCGKIPANTFLKSTYQSDAWSRKYMINYNHCSAIIDVRNTDKISLMWSETLDKIRINQDKSIYEYSDLSGEPIGTVHAGETAVFIASDGNIGEENFNIYIEKDGIKGWIKSSVSESFETLDEKVPLENIVKEEIKEELVEEDKEKVKEEINKNVNEKEKRKTVSTRDIIIICMISGFSLAIGSISILILINKKKKKNKPEFEEEKEDDNLEDKEENEEYDLELLNLEDKEENDDDDNIELLDLEDKEENDNDDNIEIE